MSKKRVNWYMTPYTQILQIHENYCTLCPYGLTITINSNKVTNDIKLTFCCYKFDKTF